MKKGSLNPQLVVPRAWLVAIVVLLVVPWLIATGVFLWTTSSDTAGPSTLRAAARPTAVSEAGGAGPWGRLTRTPIVISPPLQFVSTDWGPIRPPVWRFPDSTPDTLRAFLADAGLDAVALSSVLATLRPDPRANGVVVFPALALVRALSPTSRARIYMRLAQSALNFDQTNSFRFHGTTPGAWFDDAPISARTRELITPLLYRDGEYLHFADLELIRPDLPDVEESRRLAKALLRQASVLVSLTVDDPDEVEALATYWGRGGRQTDLRPLLESVAGLGSTQTIDIAHLLPVFARNHLHRFPRLTTADYDKPILANCLWTALNFFNETADDRVLDVQTAIDRLRREYYVVEHALQLGDIVGFLDEEGDLFHAAVYLADDLVFTKNGTSPMAPWTIMQLSALEGFYRTHTSAPRLIYHRRNGH